MAFDLGNFIQGGVGIFQQFQAANIVSSGADLQAQSIIQGGELSAQGAFLSAAGFRQSRNAVAQATQFNLQIDSMNLNRRLSAQSRQFQRVIGRQISQTASTGLAVGSKSFLQIRNEATDIFSRSMLNLKLDAENQRRSAIFTSQVQQTNLENQARAAEFQAEASRVLASNKAAEVRFQGDIAQFRARQSASQGFGTLLSQAFGGFA